MKKLTALLLAVILSLSIVPHRAWAADTWLQSPVSDLIISDIYSTTSNAYSIGLTWHQPGNITKDTAVAGPEFATAFDVYYRNATSRQAAGQPALTVPAGSAKAGDPITPPVAFNNLPLEPDSIYEFSVSPVRINTYQSGTGTTDRQADIDPKAAPEQQGLYLTDITVSAIGEGNTLTVNWSNPTLDNVDVFTGYSLYYKLISDPAFSDNPIVIPLTDPNLIIGRNGLQYTITDNSLRVGEFYEVKIEPRIGNDEVRQKNINTVTVNKKLYSFAYKPYSHEYIASGVYIKPSLQIEPEGGSYIRLTWDSLASLDARYDIARIEIYHSNTITEDPLALFNPQLIGVVSDNQQINQINYWLTAKPSGGTAYYQVIFYDRSNQASMQSVVVSYDPAYVDFRPYQPDILLLTADSIAQNMEVTWLAFAREPYTVDEANSVDPNFNNQLIDRDVLYDIYVTDAFENFNANASNPLLPVTTQSGLNLPFPAVNDNIPPTTPAYSITLSQYYTFVDGAYVLATLEPNKVYYVKIVATRIPTGVNPKPQVSSPSYDSVFIPPKEAINVDPAMLEAPPLRIATLTDKTIQISWDKKFVEIYKPDENTPGEGTWQAVMGVENGSLVYGKSALDVDNGFILNDFVDRNRLNALDTRNPVRLAEFLEDAKLKIYNRVKSLDSNAPLDLNNMTVRVVDLTQASYEIHTVEYDYMMSQGGYVPYMDTFLDNAAGGNWKPVANITENNLTLSTIVSEAQAPAPEALRPNTSYVIYIKPYQVGTDGVTRAAYYPNYVMGTTRDTESVLDIQPVSPILQPDSATHTTLTVYWAWNSLLEYDIAYSERLADYKDGGTRIPWTAINQSPNIHTDADGDTYMYYTLQNLFPDTEYYIWIRARANNTTGPANSDWSNPINMKTADLAAPQAPQGLGPAGQDHVNAYNKINSTNYAPTESNALILEWMINGNDTAPPTATGTATGGSAAMLSLSELVNMYMVRFDGLIANRLYYIRAKTVLTVTRGGDRGIQETYSYVVQVSSSDDFKDAITYTVPPITVTYPLDDYTTKQKESDWTPPIHLFTIRTAGEFDGDVNPDQYPLPANDWDITFDRYTGTLSFRFRSDQTDAAGASDQLADQRFISRLLAEKAYAYTADLSTYGSYRINTRTVEIPYSIIKAFEERNIDLTVQAGNLTLTVPPGSFNTAAVRNLPDMGVGSRVIITLSAAAMGLPVLASGESYASQPQKLSAQVITPSRTVTLDSFARPVRLDMAIDSRTLPMNQSVGLYFSNSNSGGWSVMDSQYTAASASLSANAYKAGAYAGIAKSAPSLTQTNDPTRDAMYHVTSRMAITDLKTYNPGENVTNNRFNNLIAGVANNRTQITMGSPLTNADAQSLAKANLLVEGSVTREAAINALVNLYELKTKTPLQPTDTIASTPYRDINAAEEAYRQNLLKAADIGFINGSIRPKAVLTMGELMTMLDIILLDAGL